MGAAIIWMSMLQACVTLSVAEAEMVAMSKAAQELIWLRRFLSELLGEDITSPSCIWCDNQAALALVDNRVHHARTTHIKLRGCFIKEHKDSGELDPQHVDGTKNLADIFTRVLSPAVIESHVLAIHGMNIAHTE